MIVILHANQRQSMNMSSSLAKLRCEDNIKDVSLHFAQFNPLMMQSFDDLQIKASCQRCTSLLIRLSSILFYFICVGMRAYLCLCVSLD